MANRLTSTFKLGDLLWLLIYLGMIAIVVFGMFRARSYALAEFASPQAQEQWQAWRTAVQEQKIEHETVQRKVPKSAEPPTLVLLRDHFTVCFIAAVVLSSLMFASILLFARGVLNSPAFVPRKD